MLKRKHWRKALCLGGIIQRPTADHAHTNRHTQTDTHNIHCFPVVLALSPRCVYVYVWKGEERERREKSVSEKGIEQLRSGVCRDQISDTSIKKEKILCGNPRNKSKLRLQPLRQLLSRKVMRAWWTNVQP